MYSRILVPIDNSAQSERGLVEAIALARTLGSALRLVHVVDLRSMIRGVAAGYMPPPALVDEWKADGEALVAKAVERARQAGVSAGSVVICNEALRVCDALLEEAGKSRADLIVMGTHGRRGLTRLVLGSDAELVLRNSPVPVMLVREDGPKAGSTRSPESVA